MIADTLEKLGGKRYSNVFIRKEVKKLEKSGVTADGGGGGGGEEEEGISTAAAAAGTKGEKSKDL